MGDPRDTAIFRARAKRALEPEEPPSKPKLSSFDDKRLEKMREEARDRFALEAGVEAGLHPQGTI